MTDPACAAYGWRRGRRGLVAMAIGAAVLLWCGPLGLLPPAQAESASRAEVARLLEEMLEAFTGRALTGAEIDQATDDYIRYFGSETCTGRCAEGLAIHRANLPLLRAAPDQPAALLTRQLYIAVSYFSPKERGTLLQRLLAEPDPIRVADPRTKRLLTARGVEALTNLHLFLKAGGAPRHRPLTDAELDAVAKALDEAFGAHPDARDMPLLFHLAAPFWVGVQREWAGLSEADQAAVRQYIQHTAARPMPAELYARLLDLTEEEGASLRRRDELDGFSARWSATLSRYMDVMGDAIITNLIIEGMQSAIR
jgi:hypothetical protein